MQRHEYALVTGGAKRIGAVISELLVRKNYNLIIHYNNSAKEAFDLKKRLKKINPEIDVLLFQADFTNICDIENLVEFIKNQCDFLSILVNNSSIFKKSDFLSSSIRDIDDYVKIHITAPLFLSKFLLSEKIDKKKIIINMLDERRMGNLDNIINYGDYFLYSMSKNANYLAHKYLEKEIKERKLNSRIFGFCLSLVLSGKDDVDFFEKNNTDEFESTMKIAKLRNHLEYILDHDDPNSSLIYI